MILNMFVNHELLPPFNFNIDTVHSSLNKIPLKKYESYREPMLLAANLKFEVK